MKENNNIPAGYKDSPLGIIPEDWENEQVLNFSDLVNVVKQTHTSSQTTALNAINKLATLRNWLIGYYIVEYEQKGRDRAKYGEKLLKQLETKVATKGLNETLFKNSRSFYSLYPQIKELFSSYSLSIIRPTLSDELLMATDVHSNNISLEIKQPFTFEFLGLTVDDVTEKNLEQSLINHLQDFLLELGKGFCFEARQKRIIIDDRYYFADLVFYHRLLHCNVIIELKNNEFKHEYLGQLNAYVSYYKDNEMNAGDNPPVGILLCTQKGKQMVEYAIAGMDNKLFVSTYMLQLPDKTTLEKFLLKQLKENEYTTK